jgi:hypothetical protein
LDGIAKNQAYRKAATIEKKHPVLWYLDLWGKTETRKKRSIP